MKRSRIQPKKFSESFRIREVEGLIPFGPTNQNDPYQWCP